ncbi:MAG: hypothetical protein ACREOG_18595, partial [Gemmatimonadaceae bacterium]
MSDTAEFFVAVESGNAGRVRELLALELFAIHEADVRWVRRLLTRLPALASASDRQGKPLGPYVRESGDAEI